MNEYLNDKHIMYYQDKSKEELLIDLQNLTLEVTRLKDIINNPFSNDNLNQTDLLRNESRWRFAIEEAVDGVWDWDLSTNRVFFSKQWKEMLGYSDSGIGNTVDEWKKYIHPDDLESSLKLLNNHLKGVTDSYVSEHRLICKDGSSKWVFETGKVIARNGQGNPLRIVGSNKDITHRKFTEFALHESELKYQTLIENISDVLFEVDKDGIIKYISSSIEKIIGYPAQEILGKNFGDFVGENSKSLYDRLYNLGTSKESTNEYKILTKTAEPRWIRLASTAIFKNGNLEGATGTLIDITELKIAEEALMQSEEKFSRAFLTAPYAITISRAEDGQLFEVNDSFTFHTGYTREEACSDSTISLNLWKNRNDREEIISDLKSGKNVLGREYEFIKKNGTVVTCMYSASLLFLRNTTFILSSITDITDRKLAQQKIEKMSRLYMVISHVNQAIIHFRTKDQLIHEVCRIAVEYGKFQMAWIGLVDLETQLVQPVISEGLDDGYLSVFKPISVSDDPARRGPIGTAIRLGNHFVFDDLSIDPRVGDWKEEALKRGYRSSITLPLKQFGKIAGTFTLYSEVPDFFISEEIALLDEVVNELSFAFEAIETDNQRNQTEIQLRKLSSAVEQSPVSIVITNLEGNIEYANPKTIETTGYSLEELTGTNPRLLKSGETNDLEYEALWGTISTGKEWRGIFHNKRKNGELYWESSTINPITDRNGAITHYLGVKEDITDRVKIQEALVKSEERFRQIAIQSQTVFWEMDATGLFTYVDEVSEAVWGYKPEELIGKMYFYDLHPLEGREAFKKLAFEAIARKESFKNFENQVVTADGNKIWVSTNELPLLDQHGNLLGYRGADNDITARKHAEDELLKFRTISDQANYGSVITSLDGTLIYLNEAFSGMHGYQTNELIGRNLAIFHNEEQFPKVAEFLELLNTNGSFSALEVWHTKKDGSVFPTLMNASIIQDINNVPQFFSATVIDISDLKHKEEALQRSEETLNNAQELAKMGSWEHNLVTGILTGSRNYFRLLGLEPNEIKEELYDYFINLVYPEDLKIISRLQHHAYVENEVQVAEFRIVLPNNTVRWFHQNILPLFENGRVIGLRGVTIDITDKKRDEENIRQQNERLSAIINAIPDLMFVHDSQGTSLEFYTSNPEKLLVPADQFVGTNLKDLFDEETAKLHLDKISECIRQKRLVTYDYSAENGKSVSYFEARMAPLGLNKVLSFVRDITERKQNDEAIKKLSLAVEQSPVSIVITDLKGDIEYVNSSFEKTTQFNFDEIVGQNVRVLKSGRTDKTIYENLWNTIEAGNGWSGEWINKKKNGELFWENISISPIHNESGTITNYLAVKQDITLNKKAEQEIRDLNANLELKIEARTSELATVNSKLVGEIEERIRMAEALMKSELSYRTVVENVNEVIFQTDAAGLWLFLNKSWEEVTGFTVAESLGQLFLNYVHPEDRERNMELFEPLISRKKEYCRHEIRYLTKGGGFRWVEVFARLGVNEKDEITGTYGTLLDITERKRAEEALMIKTSELENFFTVSVDLLLITDLAGNFIKFNGSWETILGYSAVELKNRHFLDLIHPDDLDKTFNAFTQLKEQLPLIDFINRYMAKDGTIRNMEWNAALVGNLIYAAGRDITERKRAEEFEDELLQLSPKLTGIPQHEIAGALNMALSRIGQFLGADRSYIFEFNADQSTMTNTYEWCNEGINPEIENLQVLPCDILPEWMKVIRRHEKIIISSVEDLPQSWQGERDILEPQGIQSLIIIPILSEQNLIGFVGLDSVRKKRVYNPSEINNLTVWSSMLASLINDLRSEKLLEQTRQNYETFFNTIDDFLFVIDQQGNIIHTNNTVNKRLEFSKQELFNQSILAVHPPERREEANRIVGEMLAGTSEYCPVPIVTKSGVQIPVETRVKPGFWNGQQVIFGVSKDISQIKLSEQKFSSAFHSNSALMAISDFYNGEYIDVNNSFIETMGYSRDELIGKTNQDIGLFVDLSLRDEIIKRMAIPIPVRKLEVEIRSKNGSIKTGLISCDSIFIGERRCLLSVTLDITERKIAEEEIKKARQAAEASNLAKSEFLSRMSHELRTPMNSILGFAQLLEMGELRSRQRSGVNHILHSGKHLLNLINEVLDISRIEAGRISLMLEPVELYGIIKEMIDSVYPLADARQLKIELVDAESNRFYVSADRQRLKQVLMNLLSNAIKYNKDAGSVSIRTRVMGVQESGVPQIRISITDTGIGITNTDIPKLFTPFERIGAENTQTEGTGLGLAVVKKLMDAMSGKIGVESKSGEGSTFWIEFPLIESLSQGNDNDENLTGSALSLPCESGTILYVEDNSSNIELVEQILETQRSNIKLISTMHGKQAVPLALKFKPNLIFLDLNLPDIQGDEVLSLLQNEEGSKAIPVVMISADAMPQQLEKLLNAGAQNYLTKPLDVYAFLAEVDKWLGYKIKNKE